MDGRDLESRLVPVAKRLLKASLDSADTLPEGVRLVDSWQNERYGGVLFWIDTNLNLNGWGTAVLHDALLRRDGHGWRPMGAGGTGTGTAAEVAAEKD